MVEAPCGGDPMLLPQHAIEVAEAQPDEKVGDQKNNRNHDQEDDGSNRDHDWDRGPVHVPELEIRMRRVRYPVVSSWKARAEIARGHAALSEKRHQGQLEKGAQTKWPEEKLLSSFDRRTNGLSRGKGDHGLWRKA